MTALERARRRKRRVTRTAQVVADSEARADLDLLDRQIRQLQLDLRKGPDADDLSAPSAATELSRLEAEREEMRQSLDTIEFKFQAVGRGFMRQIEAKYPPTEDDIEAAREDNNPPPEFSLSDINPAKKRYGAMCEVFAKSCIEIDGEPAETTPEEWYELCYGEDSWSTGEVEYLWTTALSCEGSSSQVPFSKADLEKMVDFVSNLTSASETDEHSDMTNS